MTDRITVRLVIGSLSALALVVVVGGIVLALDDKSLPGELIAIGSLAAGAVAGILSKTGHSEPTEVTGPRGGPVPVVDEGGHADTALVTCIACVLIAAVVVLWAVGVDFPLD